ncbi:hypothetical protein ABEG17_08470 [Pedococcus sp. KACC 23699]|uniref:Uncharacterized protein n=1 Tax=Pedococcus sp. KACC 23699 TaxID=3149228 RepID=A0AAU7JYV0_9MICO
MTTNTKYSAGDLVLIVWPKQRAAEVHSGDSTWEDVSHGSWAMDAHKADAVSILVAVHEGVVVGAWRVTGANHSLAAPAGKTRNVNRSTFDLSDDPRLAYLVGGPSPAPAQRNPQTTRQLRDLPGADTLLDPSPATHGVVQLGGYTLTVNSDGTALLRLPGGAALAISEG